MRPLRHVRLFQNFVPLLFAVAVSLLPSACSSSSKGGGGGGGAPTGAVARFDLTTNAVPNFLDVPFPSDVYLQNGQVMDLPGVDALITQNATFLTHELAKMDGFSRIALAMFYVDDTTAPAADDGTVGFAQLDPTTFPAGEAACVADTSSMFLVDLDATDPTQARVTCRQLYHQEYLDTTKRTLAAVGPAEGIVLAEGHHYAGVLTSRVKTTDGRAVQASADFRKVQAGDASVPAVYTSAYQTVVRDLARALASDGAQVVAIAPFTTNSASKQLYALRDSLEAATVPPLTFDAASMAPMQAEKFAQPVSGTLPQGFAASLDDWLGVTTKKLPDGSDDPDATLLVPAHDKIAVVGTGVFQAQFYLTGWGNGYSTLDAATFTTDASGNIVPAPDKPTDSIWVTFAVPTAPMPSGGYPTIIYQHGLNGSRDDIFNVANPLCAQGWMVVAIDSITFGARAPETSYQVDAKSDFAKDPGATYAGPDGFGDEDKTGAHNGSFDLFGSLLDVGAVRDQFRQAAIDTVQLVKVLRAGPDLSALAWNGVTAKIDTSRIAYLGMSLGSIQGAAAAAIEPHVSLWALNVAGGGLIEELGTHSPVISTELDEAAGFNFGILEATLDESNPLVNLIQAVVEPGDPLSLAGNIVLHPQPLAGQPTQARDVLQFEVLYDELVPNESDEALARAGGWGLAQPDVGSNSGIIDYKNLADNPWRLTLPEVAAQADGSIHDTPSPGVTAIVVQESPGTHGDNMISSTGTRQYCIPFANFASGTPFDHLDTSQDFSVPDPYLQTQQTIEGFFSDGFAGKVPGVVVHVAAVRDLDGDGATDDVDSQPCNPAVK
jgi:dienelactone hydrolase